MNDLDLIDLQQTLKRKEAELAGWLSKREGIDIELSSDSSDEAQLQSERELAARSLHRDYSLLLAVRLALRRIAAGTSGLCQHCDRDISLKRLRAIPWTPYCLRCQEELDAARDEQNGEEDDSAAAA